MSSAIVPVYARADLAFERGDGCWLTATTGERYLDFGAGIAVNALGHSHPASRRGADRAGAASSGTPPTCSRSPTASGWRGGSPTRPSPIWSSSPIPAPRPTKRRSRWRASAMRSTAIPRRYRILTFEGAFHGRTLATIAAGGQAEVSRRLRPQGRRLRPDRRSPTSPPSRRRSARETGAILIEPIQGEGGVRVVPAAFLRGLRALVRRARPAADLRRDPDRRRPHRQACSPMSIRASAPDIMTIAKGIGGGFPMGACLATADAAQGLTVGVARHDLRRQSAGDGGRQRRARRGPGARLHRARRAARPVRCASGSPS